MSLRRFLAKSALSVAALATASVAHAGFYGTTFGTYYGYPDAATPYPGVIASPPTFVAGAGVETVLNVEGVTTISVDFADNVLSLVLNTSLGNPTWAVSPSNGPVFDVLAGGPLSFVGLVIDPATTMAGFSASRVDLTSSRLAIDWNGLSYVDGTKVVIDFTAAAVPEPETYALMMLGLGLIGAVARKRR